MKKRVLSLILVSILLFTFVGCGNKNESNETVKEQSADEETVTITYSLWGEYDRIEYTKEIIEAFEKEYPNINVELNYETWDVLKNKIDYIMISGNDADVMQINYNWLRKYSEDGTGFYDLNELSGYLSLDAYSDISIAYGQVNGKQNALPIAFNTSIPVYNQTMYEYYNLEVPQSVDDLFADAEIMKKDSVYQLGLEDKQIVLFLLGCYMNECNADVVDSDGNLKLTNAACQYIAETYKSCIDSCVICPRSSYSDTYIEGNRVAGVICWLNSIEKYKSYMKNAGDEPVIGSFLWTDTSKKLGNFVKPATMMAISAHTEHPKEAAIFLNYLLNDETAVNLAGVEKGMPDSRFAQQYLMKAGSLNNDTFYGTLSMNYYMEYMHALPDSLDDSTTVENILSALDSYANGNKSLDETISVLKEIK